MTASIRLPDGRTVTVTPAGADALRRLLRHGEMYRDEAHHATLSKLHRDGLITPGTSPGGYAEYYLTDDGRYVAHMVTRTEP